MVVTMEARNTTAAPGGGGGGADDDLDEAELQAIIAEFERQDASLAEKKQQGLISPIPTAAAVAAAQAAPLSLYEEMIRYQEEHGIEDADAAIGVLNGDEASRPPASQRQQSDKSEDDRKPPAETKGIYRQPISRTHFNRKSSKHVPQTELLCSTSQALSAVSDTTEDSNRDQTSEPMAGERSDVLHNTAASRPLTAGASTGVASRMLSDEELARQLHEEQRLLHRSTPTRDKDTAIHPGSPAESLDEDEAELLRALTGIPSPPIREKKPVTNYAPVAAAAAAAAAEPVSDDSGLSLEELEEQKRLLEKFNRDKEQQEYEAALRVSQREAKPVVKEKIEETWSMLRKQRSAAAPTQSSRDSVQSAQPSRLSMQQNSSRPSSTDQQYRQDGLSARSTSSRQNAQNLQQIAPQLPFPDDGQYRQGNHMDRHQRVPGGSVGGNAQRRVDSDYDSYPRQGNLGVRGGGGAPVYGASSSVGGQRAAPRNSFDDRPRNPMPNDAYSYNDMYQSQPLPPDDDFYERRGHMAQPAGEPYPGNPIPSTRYDVQSQRSRSQSPNHPSLPPSNIRQGAPRRSRHRSESGSRYIAYNSGGEPPSPSHTDYGRYPASQVERPPPVGRQQPRAATHGSRDSLYQTSPDRRAPQHRGSDDVLYDDDDYSLPPTSGPPLGGKNGVDYQNGYGYPNGAPPLRREETNMSYDDRCYPQQPASNQRTESNYVAYDNDYRRQPLPRSAVPRAPVPRMDDDQYASPPSRGSQRNGTYDSRYYSNNPPPRRDQGPYREDDSPMQSRRVAPIRRPPIEDNLSPSINGADHGRYYSNSQPRGPVRRDDVPYREDEVPIVPRGVVATRHAPQDDDISAMTSVNGDDDGRYYSNSQLRGPSRRSQAPYREDEVPMRPRGANRRAPPQDDLSPMGSMHGDDDSRYYSNSPPRGPLRRDNGPPPHREDEVPRQSRGVGASRRPQVEDDLSAMGSIQGDDDSRYYSSNQQPRGPVRRDHAPQAYREDLRPRLTRGGRPPQHEDEISAMGSFHGEEDMSQRHGVHEDRYYSNTPQPHGRRDKGALPYREGDVPIQPRPAARRLRKEDDLSTIGSSRGEIGSSSRGEEDPIYNGGGATDRESLLIRGMRETERAVLAGKARIVHCLNCQRRLQAPEHCTLVKCPTCGLVSPCSENKSAAGGPTRPLR